MAGLVVYCTCGQVFVGPTMTGFALTEEWMRWMTSHSDPGHRLCTREEAEQLLDARRACKGHPAACIAECSTCDPRAALRARAS